MATAHYVKTLGRGYFWEQRLYRIEGHANTEYVVTSSIKRNLLINETMAFWANEAGEIVDWGELATEAANEHVACLEAAGFEVVKP